MKKKLFILSLIIVITGMNLEAQNDISMATHWYNRANYNPASIARTDYMYLFFNARQQWLGVQGAPKILNLQASEYFRNIHSAFGLSLVSDVIGVSQAYNPMVSYAYLIQGDRNWSLSMGLSGGMFIRTINGSLFEAETITDPSIHYSTDKLNQPDANVGFEFQTTHFVVCLSSTHLFSFSRSDSLYLNSNHRYLSAIYRNTNAELFNYNVGLQLVNRQRMNVLEGNVNIRIKHPSGLMSGPQELLDLGITYRTSRQVTLLFGINISPNFRVGYAYNQSFITGYYLNSTHEIMVEYRIPNKMASARSTCGFKGNWYN
jgi:type IX secretion system PorP/SprF family membrane protein